jgi:NAD(P)-dependent dehydrogenase (short-subunit alcohol dehydrogenase family)
VKAVPHYGDVADFQAAKDMIETCVENFGSIDILCNIAGNKPGNSLFDISEEEWDRTIAIHLKGTFNLTRHAAPLMRDQKYGRILNCISDAWIGTKAVHYAAAKGGIASLTYATALEMDKYGVTCNAFAPIIGTRYSRDDETKQVSEMQARLRPNVESGAWSKKRFEEVTDALLAPMEYSGPIFAFLCSEHAGDITGRIFGIAATKLSYWSTAEQTRVFARDWKTQGGWTWEEVEKNMPLLLGGWR